MGKGTPKSRQNSSERNREIDKLKEQVLQLSKELKNCKEEQYISGEISEEGYLFHKNLIITGSNSAFTKMIGYEVSDLIGNTIEQFLTTNSYAILSEHMSGSERQSFEIEMVKRDGKVVNVLARRLSILVEGFNRQTLVVQDISKVEEAQSALQDSEERNRALSENTNEALFFSDQGKCIEANRAAYEMFGYVDDELIGLFGTDVIADESKEFVKQNMMSGNEYPYEAIAQRKDGSTFFAEFEGKMYNYKGKRVRVTSVRDISRRKKAEEALIISEELHRKISGLVTDFVYACKVLPGKRLYFEWGGENFAQLTGYTIDEIHGFERTWLSIVHPDDVERIIKEIDNNDFETDSRHVEYRIIKKQGEIAWLSNNLIIEFDGENNIIHLLGAVQDITPRKSAETALKESEEKHRQISGMLSDYIYSFRMKPNESSDTLWVSGAFEKICGYSLDEIHEMGEGWFSIVHPDDVQALAESAMRDLTENGFSNHEYRIIDKQGDIKWLQDLNTLVNIDESGSEITVLGATKDITVRKVIEEDLRQKNIESEKLNEQLSLKNREILNINEVLKESEEKYKNLVENSPLGVGISVGDKLVFSNKALLDIYGVETLKEISERKLSNYMTVESREIVNKMLENTHDKFSIERKYQFQIIRASGEIRTLDISSTDIYYNGQKCRQAIINDITDKRNAEQALKESEEKYKSLVENSPLGVGIVKGDQMLFANKAFLDIYGIESFDEFASKRITEYLPQSSKAFFKERMEKIEKNIKVESKFRHEIIRTDGEIRFLDANVSDIIFNDTKCRQVILNDVTLEKENEEALQRAANIFKSIQVGLFIYHLEDIEDDHSLRLVAANPASSELVGQAVKDMVGKRIDENFPNLRMAKIPQQYVEVVKNQIPIAMEDVYYGDENIEYSTFSIKVFPLPNQCVGVSFENVSARRNAENELRVRNNELNNFVYKVSHDLKAPLSSIKGLINLTKMEGNKHDHMPMIEDRIDKLDGFIRDILSHSRNLNTAVIIEKLDLEDIMKYCFDELDYLPHSKSIEKSVHQSGVDFYNDKIRLAEISRNLVSNSIKYQNPHNGKMYVKVNIDVTPKYGTITFEDNGIGIKKEYLKNIFKMFYRATDTSEGSGIGLYIVKQAVEKLGGKIRVESEYGQGAKFTIKLPNLISKRNPLT